MEIESYTLSPFMSNCLVMKDNGEAIVIDPGEPSQEVVDTLAGFTVPMIFNTHCHADHSGGNAAMMAATGAPLVIHADDLPLLHALEQQGAMFGVQVEASPEPDRFVKEGDTIKVGTVEMKVLHTPGHAPGHVVLVGDGFVIAGDVLFQGSIGRTDLPGGNHQQLLDSIREKLLPLPDDTVVYCGHGPSTTIGAERRSNPFLVGL